MGNSNGPADRLPVEDLENGLYIHQPHNGLSGTEVTQMRLPDGTEHYLVSAQDFMAVQRERDEYRRALHFIGSTDPNEQILRILDKAGIEREISAAVGDIVRQYQQHGHI